MKKNQQRMQTDPDTPYISNRVMTIPNIICLIRLVGCLILLPNALQGDSQLFLWLFLFLAITDWIDGKLAILLNQRSVLGARLDSWADAALYAALLFGLLAMYRETLSEELGWILPAIGTYVISTAVGFLKYRRWPSYHTRAAKTGWLVTLIAVICLFSDWSIWPLRIATVTVVITNLEALLITLISPTWQVDVTSIYHAWRDQRAA